MTRVIMNGCNGKMGQCITNICKDDPEITIVAGIDVYQGIENEYPVFSSIGECDVEADVIIDFSNAKAIDELLDYCQMKEMPVVLCTTGLSEEQNARVSQVSQHTAVLKSANMSLGINTLMELLRKEVAQDPVPTQVVDMTKLNLVEVTRKKILKSLKEQLT